MPVDPQNWRVWVDWRRRVDLVGRRMGTQSVHGGGKGSVSGTGTRRDAGDAARRASGSRSSRVLSPNLHHPSSPPRPHRLEQLHHFPLLFSAHVKANSTSHHARYACAGILHYSLADVDEKDIFVHVYFVLDHFHIVFLLGD